jgi:uncharacterized protein YijF (DUF1287 family)
MTFARRALAWCVLFACSVAFLPAEPAATHHNKIILAARAQIGVTTGYDPAYRSMDYPGGDVPASSGVCTDVVIRALRKAMGFDLQQQVHEDMKGNFSRYPGIWGLRRTDRNIDHRRVPNLQTFFTRKGWKQPLPAQPEEYQPGDIVTCIVPPNLPHIMIVSERRTPAGRPLVIHNIGRGVREEDHLADFPITGRYCVPAP